MLTLGFTNHYYTLWNVTSLIRYGAGETINGVFNGQSWMVTRYTYMQNLSMEYDEAIAKITVRAGINGFDEDLDLRGEHGSFERTVRQLRILPDYYFTFGKLNGQDMRVSNDVWQLNRAMKVETKMRGRVYARRRLIELGELVRYKWIDEVFDEASCATTPYDESATFWKKVTRNYALVKDAAFMENKKKEAEMSDHFYTNGEKVALTVTLLRTHSFEGSFGLTFIHTYQTDDNKIVKYMGANPPSIEKGATVRIKATIKHGEYRDQKDTKLQRIKVI